MTERSLVVSRVCAGHGRVQLLWDVSITVPPGSVVALLGPNGAGKTTLMRTITGLTRTWSGHIGIGDGDLTDHPCHRRIASGLGMVPAGRKLFLGLSVEENLRMGAFLIRSRKEVSHKLKQVYDLFPPLAERRSRRVSELSGGEQQMCAVGRGLMTSPQFLLVDELSMGLAPLVTARLLTTLIEFSRQHDVGVLLVEQDVRTALRAADYGYVLEQGRLVLEGAASQLIESSDLKRIFVGSV